MTSLFLFLGKVAITVFPEERCLVLYFALLRRK